MALILLSVVILVVAIDAIGQRPSRDEPSITTQKIIVDLTKRR